MHAGITQSVLLAIVFIASPLLSQTGTQDDLAKPFDWPLITSSAPGIQFSLRTRWEAYHGLRYVATLTDSKGRVAKYFLKHPDNGRAPMSSFYVTFLDEAGFRLYTLYIPDREFSKVADTANFEANDQAPCDDKVYMELLKAAKASSAAAKITYKLSYPTELTDPPKP